MIEHIPFVFELDHGTVVVPHCRVTAKVIDYYPTVCVRACDAVGCRISKAGRHPSSADVSEHKVVCPIVLECLYSLVEMMIGFGDDPVLYGRGVDASHVGIQLGAFGGEPCAR